MIWSVVLPRYHGQLLSLSGNTTVYFTQHTRSLGKNVIPPLGPNGRPVLYRLYGYT
jgi:hypothetical protein